MKTVFIVFLSGIIITGGFILINYPTVCTGEKRKIFHNKMIVELPEYNYKSGLSWEEVLRKRRSTRSYGKEPLALKDLSQLLFAAQGITDRNGFRTAPSAGALYPLELIVLAGHVNGLAKGVYRYNPEKHTLTKIASGDKRGELCNAALGQQCILEGSAVLIITAVFKRTEVKYRRRAERYVYMEAGHVSQNVYLQAAAMDIGTVAVGAFDDDRVAGLLDLMPEEHPIYIMPLGQKK